MHFASLNYEIFYNFQKIIQNRTSAFQLKAQKKPLISERLLLSGWKTGFYFKSAKLLTAKYLSEVKPSACSTPTNRPKSLER